MKIPPSSLAASYKHKLGIPSAMETPGLHHALHNAPCNKKQFNNKVLNQNCSLENEGVRWATHAGGCLCPCHSLSCPRQVGALRCTASTGNSCTSELTSQHNYQDKEESSGSGTLFSQPELLQISPEKKPKPAQFYLFFLLFPRSLLYRNTTVLPALSPSGNAHFRHLNL